MGLREIGLAIIKFKMFVGSVASSAPVYWRLAAGFVILRGCWLRGLTFRFMSNKCDTSST